MSIYVGIGHADGKVILRFFNDAACTEPATVHQWEVDPSCTMDIAEALSRNGWEAHGTTPVGSALKADLIERHRMTLTHRYSVMLNTLREDKGQSNGKLAQTLVDAALKEIF